MEDLFALLDDHTVAREIFLIKGSIRSRYLGIIDANAALLHQTARFAVGSTQTAGC